MATQPANRPTIAPLESWAPLHPAAVALLAGTLDLPSNRHPAPPRSPALAAALAESNRACGNRVDGELDRWLAGARVVVTGQQPGLLGGPLLTLVKACAVAAEVRRLRAAGGDAVGFLWLATGDDDLPEMGWGRLALGEEVLQVREPAWQRGDALAGPVRLSDACATFLDGLKGRLLAGHAGEAVALAADCYRPGETLGDATARMLARLLTGSGVVLVDALLPELAIAGAPAVVATLERLSEAWEVLASGAEAMQGHGWPVPLRLSRQKLPLFRRAGDRRESLPTTRGSAPAALIVEQQQHPERFLPNVWLRPLVADAALGVDTALLGGAELAYHVQAAGLWELAGLARPEWRLRPHLMVVTAAERRLAGQLGVRPEHLLRPQPPLHALRGTRTRKQLERLRTASDRRLAALARTAGEELPALAGEVEATGKKLAAAVAWLGERVAAAATRDAEVEMGRWRRLKAFLRPEGRPQERHLSVLAPLLRLGVNWPTQLVATLDPTHPGMHLLFWEEGGAW